MELTKSELDDLRPSDTPAYMHEAWIGCIIFAVQTPEIVAEFRQDTGLQWRPATSPIDRMIDEATGREKEFVVEFVKWVNVNLWGEIA